MGCDPIGLGSTRVTSWKSVRMSPSPKEGGFRNTFCAHNEDYDNCYCFSLMSLKQLFYFLYWNSYSCQKNPHKVRQIGSILRGARYPAAPIGLPAPALDATPLVQ